MKQIEINTKKDFLKILRNKFFSRIFILSGRNSFEKSGARELLKKYK